MSTSPNSKRNLKPSPTSASSVQPSFATTLSPFQGMSQPIEQQSPFVAAQQSPPNPKKRRASGQPTQMAPSPIAPAPMPTSSSYAEPSGVAAPTSEAQASAPPPAKKGRTNTPWTPAEELRLKHMRDAGKSWSEIAKSFPARTEGSVKKHWYKDMHYAEFAEDESAALLAAIKEYESNKWKVIGQKVGKPAKACEQYAKEHFGGKI